MTKNVLLALATLCIAVPAYAATYKIDPDHSEVGFKVKHLAISSVKGNFNEFAGNFTYDPAKLETSKAEAVINVGSVDTNQKKRDDHLKADEFFSAGKFPAIKFQSKEVKDVTKDGFKLLGDLTIRDVTKPVTLDVKVGGTTTDPWGNERAAFSASTTINRKEFGLTYGKVLETGALVVGDTVDIVLEVEGIKEKAA